MKTDKLLIHASSLGKIMTNSKVASDPLGETCRTHLMEIFIQNNYGRYKDFETKMMEKGNINEESCITMLSNKYKKFFVKNEVTKSNEYLIGTCDIDDEEDNHIYDTKAPWSLFTFMSAKLTKDYLWQGRAYMELYDRETFTLAYCLTDTPVKLIEDEIRRIMWKCTDESLYEDVRNGCYKQMTYSDIDERLKVKTFTIKRDKEIMKEAYKKIDLCREEYSKYSL